MIAAAQNGPTPKAKVTQVFRSTALPIEKRLDAIPVPMLQLDQGKSVV
jgi:hypothetical protein